MHIRAATGCCYAAAVAAAAELYQALPASGPTWSAQHRRRANYVKKAVQPCTYISISAQADISGCTAAASMHL